MGWLDADTIVATTPTAALLAAGTAIEAAGGRLRPGASAGTSRAPHSAMGFCLRQRGDRRAQAEHADGDRVAIVDYDVHHGNGTQEIFWEDDTVLFVSLHQWPFYPGSGGPDDKATRP